MVESDKQEFKTLMKGTFSIYQQEITGGVALIWWNSLIRFEFNKVNEAFSRYIQDPKSGKFAPKPADIIGIIETMNPDGRIGAEEAWATYPHNEASSAVITNEMAEAMQVAQELLNEGDKVGARMAFKEAYNRIVENNKFNGIAPTWFPSLGHDKEGRELALKAAIEKGRLTQEHALKLLPPAINPNVSAAIGEMQLLTNKVEITDEAREKAKEKMAKIRNMFNHVEKS
jgi:hypothetical protein